MDPYQYAQVTNVFWHPTPHFPKDSHKNYSIIAIYSVSFQIDFRDIPALGADAVEVVGPVGEVVTVEVDGKVVVVGAAVVEELLPFRLFNRSVS